jgi:transcriptional regulator with XRE-family HTH domain
MKTMADRIKYVRDFILVLTQEELADKLGVKRGSVGNWELGGGLSRKNLSALARMAGCSMEWIESGKGQAPVEKPTHSIVKTQTARVEPTTGADADREAALIQGITAAFGVTGEHAVELETLLRRVLREQLSGQSREETLASRRDLVRYVTREFLHSKGLKDGEG